MNDQDNTKLRKCFRTIKPNDKKTEYPKTVKIGIKEFETTSINKLPHRQVIIKYLLKVMPVINAPGTWEMVPSKTASVPAISPTHL